MLTFLYILYIVLINANYVAVKNLVIHSKGFF